VVEAAVVDEWRERSCLARPSRGVPPHITLVFPFVPADGIDEEVVSSLGALFAASERFEFELRETRRFPATLYLPPAPAAPFVRLTDAIVARFPEHPPYGGAFDSIEPHLTVAQGEPEVLSEAEEAVRPLLPISSEACEAVLLEEVEPDWGRWRIHTRLPFGG
jgi:2'-5' RNA ligase